MITLVGSPGVTAAKQQLFCVMKTVTGLWWAGSFLSTLCINCMEPLYWRYMLIITTLLAVGKWQESWRPVCVIWIMLDIDLYAFCAHCFTREAYSMFRAGKEHVLLKESW